MSVIFNHEIYNYKDSGAICLNNEAYKLLKATILIGNRNELKKEELKDVEIIENMSNYEMGPLSRSLFDNPFVDYFIVAAAVEIFLKSKLIENGYIVHVINRNCNQFTKLSEKQKYQPVKFSEYCINKDCETYRAKNKETELTQLTVTSGILLNKPEYIKVLNLDHDVLKILKGITNRRNRIHLPTDGMPEEYKLDSKSFDILIDYINREFVDKANELKKRVLPEKKAYNRF